MQTSNSVIRHSGLDSNQHSVNDIAASSMFNSYSIERLFHGAEF
jgi:hypothetical protein